MADYPSKEEAAASGSQDGLQLAISGRALRRTGWAVVVVVILGAIGIGVFLLLRPGEPSEGLADPDRWQAVFLEGGQVFFGHLEEADPGFLRLRDAFFLEEIPGVEEGEPTTQQVRSTAELLHGPEPNMLLARSSIVRIEDLHPDSEVAQAIERVLEQRD